MKTLHRRFRFVSGGIVWIAVWALGPVARGAEGADLFVQQCAPCHGEDGKARNPAAKKLGVRDLTVSKLTDAEIEKQVRDGVRNKRGLEVMPAFKEKLTPEEIQAVVAAVKRLRK
ncbi:MAG: cytochrome c [Opitutae bacterium]|nr:cytochrome c [Opitutae bacterium]